MACYLRQILLVLQKYMLLWKSTKPDVVINAAGKTGRPNVDWCEDHKLETVNSNITGPLVLLNACSQKNIRLVHLSSGCIFDGSEIFTEESTPNPVSFYAWTKAQCDEMLKEFPVLILRIRMPVDDAPSNRNLIDKLAKYEKIVDVENSITVISDLLSATKQLIDQNAIGIYNMVNPGSIKHAEILALYKELVDPAHTFELVSMEDLAKQGLIKAGRSNCVLSTEKLSAAGIQMREVHEAVRDCLTKYRK